MKKILFASSALVAASLLTAGTASAAEKIQLKVGGFSKWWVVGQWQADRYTNSAQGTALGSFVANNELTTASAGTARSYPNADIKGDNEIWFGGSTTLDNGLKIGVDIHLEAGGHSDSTTDTIDKSYIYVEGGFGKFIVGSQANGAALLHVNAPDAAGNWGAGGIMTGGLAVAKPWHVNAMAGGNTTAIATVGNAEALTYVAPAFYGLTVGASYIPSSLEDQRGLNNLNMFSLNSAGTTTSTVPATASSAIPVKEVWGAGALFANTFGGVGVKVSYGVATARLSEGLGIKGWFEQTTGAQLSYAGFTLGGSWRHQQANYGNANGAISAATGLSALDLGSLAGQTGGGGSFGNGQAFDVGIQYATGPYAVSFAYFHSAVEHCRLSQATNPAALVGASCNRIDLAGGANAAGGGGSGFANGEDTIDAYQLSGKYNLGPGVDVLASAGYIEYNSARGEASGGIDSSNNSGWTVMSGVSLAF